MNKRIPSIIALGVVVVLAIAIGGVFLLQNKNTTEPMKVPLVKVESNEQGDETADWQTYRNEEYGFELKYPSNLIIQEKLNEFTKEKFISFRDKICEDGEHCGDNSLALFVSITNSSNEITMDSFNKIKSEFGEFANEKEVYYLGENKIDFYIISERTEEKNNMTWDLVIPTAKGFLTAKEYSYTFNGHTELNAKLQGKEVEYLREFIKFFKFID